MDHSRNHAILNTHEHQHPNHVQITASLVWEVIWVTHTHTCWAPMECVFHTSDAFRVNSVGEASSTLVFLCFRPSVHHFFFSLLIFL